MKLPLDCALGENCAITAYPDIDPTDGVSDYRCGAKTYDQHSGTDISLSSFDQLRSGVSVLAAADGTITALRDTLPDRPVTASDDTGQSCGNAIRIDHRNGYQTVYCHLKNGSVRVSVGDQVFEGEPIAQVGLSGHTDHPHLHLTVTQGENVIDPFAPDQNNACEVADQTLWHDAPLYLETGLAVAGVSNRVPNMDEAGAPQNRRDAMPATDPLVLYGYGQKGHADDVVDLALRGPDGDVFRHQARLTEDQPRFIRAFGRRAPDEGWAMGEYIGTVTLLRGQTVVSVRHTVVTVR